MRVLITSVLRSVWHCVTYVSPDFGEEFTYASPAKMSYRVILSTTNLLLVVVFQRLQGFFSVKFCDLGV